MICRIMICTESREKRVCSGSGTIASTAAGFFAILVYLFSIFNTVFLIQELASVPAMKRFLTSKTSEARADTADLARERATHPWRSLDLPAARRHSFSARSISGMGRPRLSLADVSAPASPSQVYARAASAAAAAASVADYEAFRPHITSTPVPDASQMPPPTLLAPRAGPPPGFSSAPPPHRPAPVFLSPTLAPPASKLSPQLHRPSHQSTSAAAASWHARAAAAREARRPAWTKPSASNPTPPSAELVALADRFRSAASAQQAHQIQQQIHHQLADDPDTSAAASFYSAVLHSSSIIDCDVSFVDNVQPPLTPVVYNVPTPAVLSANTSVGHVA
jgi:hypothetical protein